MPTNEDRMFHINNQADPSTLRDYERAVPTSVAKAIARDHISETRGIPSTPG